MRARLSTLMALAALAAPMAFAASEKEGLLAPFFDPVTHMVALSIAVFFFIAHRMGAFKALLGGLDGRAEKIRTELEEAQSLREQAAAALAAAERRAADAGKEAASLIEQARKDADRIVDEARKEMAEKLARREAQAAARIARAEADAESDVRRAAADAATAAVRTILTAGKDKNAFDRAAAEIEKALK